MYELTVIIGKGRVIVGTARGWYLFMEEGFGDGGGVYVSSRFQNFRQFFVTILTNSISNFIIDMSFFLTGEIQNTENTSHDNSRCFNLSSKYRFYLYCNLRR